MECTLLAAVAIFIFFLTLQMLLVKFQTEGKEQYSRTIPFFRCVPYIMQNKRPEMLLSNLSRKYGEVFTLQLGSARVVGCCGAKSVRTVLQNKNLSDRPTGDFLRTRDPLKKDVIGLMSTSGKDWTELHHLVVKLLKGACSNLDLIFEKHIKNLFKKLDELEGGIVPNVQALFSPLVLMVLWEVLTGETIAADNSDFKKFVEKNKEFFQNGNILTNSLMFSPYLYGVLPLFPSYRRFRDANDALAAMITAAIQRREAEGFNTSCFIDGYLREIYGGTSTSFLNESCLTVTLMDIFNAGAESTGNATGFAILRLLHHPDVHRKVVADISCHASSNSLYFEAFLMEVLRTSSVAPLSLPHLAVKDTYLPECEGIIKKGSIIVANLWSVHHDPSQWPEPDVFDPERHLVNERVNRSHHFIPYGSGKRACPGEPISQYIYKNTIMSILKRYDISSSGQLPSLEPVKGFTLSPQPFDLCVKHKIV